MLAEVGPGSYTKRPDILDRTADGLPRLVPLRGTTSASVSGRDPDPRGLPVIGADGHVAGIDGKVDRNAFFGTPEQWQAFLNPGQTTALR